MELISYNGNSYPALQGSGNAARFTIPLALEFCKGDGFDIGCNRPDWQFSGSVGIDPEMGDFSAMDLPPVKMDYIFSSHCLEHLPDYVSALDYWSTKLKRHGCLFLYLPNMDYQQYWQPENNRKHLHYISPKVMQSYFNNRQEMWENAIVTEGYDLNGSFYAVAERRYD